MDLHDSIGRGDRQNFRDAYFRVHWLCRVRSMRGILLKPDSLLLARAAFEQISFERGRVRNLRDWILAD